MLVLFLLLLFNQLCAAQSSNECGKLKVISGDVKKSYQDRKLEYLKRVIKELEDLEGFDWYVGGNGHFILDMGCSTSVDTLEIINSWSPGQAG